MVRPLETLHNALSLRQLDAFLSFVTSANFKAPPSGYLPIPPSCKFNMLHPTIEEHVDETSEQPNHKRSIPPRTLGLTSSQNSSK